MNYGVEMTKEEEAEEETNQGQDQFEQGNPAHGFRQKVKMLKDHDPGDVDVVSTVGLDKQKLLDNINVQNEMIRHERSVAQLIKDMNQMQS